MKEKDLRKHQLKALEALKEIDKIFKENNIQYFILAGTTLGAVRHKGFIPWDDDIDIGIFRKDKNRAYELLKNQISDEFNWIDRSIKSDFPRFYGKVIHNGAGCVDVFVLTKASNKNSQRKKQWFFRKIYYKLYKGKIGYSNKNESTAFLKRLSTFIFKIISKFFSLNFITKHNEKNELRFEDLTDNSHYMNFYSPYSMEKELIKSEWLNSSNEVMFEGDFYPTVADTHAYLTHLYDDYMTLPKESERISRHDEVFNIN